MGNNTRRVSGIIDGIRENNETEHRLDLMFGECAITVFTNSPELLSKLSRYFDGFVTIVKNESYIAVYAVQGAIPEFDFEFEVKQPDPGKTKIKEEHADFIDGRIIRKRLTGMIFMFGEGENLAIGPCVDNDNQVINFVNSRHIQWELNRDGLLCHAAGVSRNGDGLALAGFSGMGKSTLALHLMSRGTHFVSNDRLVIRMEDDAPTMTGVAKLPRINPGTALHNEHLAGIIAPEDKSQFLSLPPDELWKLEHKYDVFIDECFGAGKFSLSAPMRGLVILNWNRNGDPLTFRKVNLRERRDLLSAFTKSTGLFFEPEADFPEPDFSDEAYLDIMDNCEVFEINGGVDFDAAADACLEFLVSAGQGGVRK